MIGPNLWRTRSNPGNHACQSFWGGGSRVVPGGNHHTRATTGRTHMLGGIGEWLVSWQVLLTRHFRALISIVSPPPPPLPLDAMDSANLARTSASSCRCCYWWAALFLLVVTFRNVRLAFTASSCILGAVQRSLDWRQQPTVGRCTWRLRSKNSLLSWR